MGHVKIVPHFMRDNTGIGGDGKGHLINAT
jgi:hypothetical protein